MENNRSAYGRVADRYLSRELCPAERRLLSQLRARLPEMDLLDLGVGAGRTAFTFSALSRSYVGVDYAPEMIELCRHNVGESETVKFLLRDASDLSSFPDERFDLILFSFNGIDYVGPEKRVRVLREVRRLLRGESSYFFFSTHSLHGYPFPTALPSFDLRNPAIWSYRFAREAARHLKVKWLNRDVPPTEAKERGWAVLNDGLHGFTITTHYIMPEHQVAQLDENGLAVEAVYDVRGEAIDWKIPRRDPWLHFLCRPKVTDARATDC